METPYLHRDGAGSSEGTQPGNPPEEGPGVSPSSSIPSDEIQADKAPGPITSSSGIAYQDEAVSMVDEQNAQQVRELLRSLVRALKAKKMYPSNNPVLGRIMREFLDSMLELLDELQELTVNVESYQFTYCGLSVYKNESKRDSLAYRFHRDGITQLSIIKGITRPELNAFLDVLALATEPSGAEEDLVTYLWEQEFTNIRYSYLAIDDLQEGMLEGLEEGDSEMREIPWPQGDDENYSGDLVIPGDDAEGSGERSDDWAQLVPVDLVTERCPQYLLEISEAELQEVAEEVHLEHSRPLTEIVLEILTEVAEDETNADRFSDFARAFAELVSLSIADADFARAAQVLATLNTLAVERGVDAKSFLPDGRDLVSQAAASIHHSPETDVTSLPEFLAHLGPSAIDPVCDLLNDRDFETLQPMLAGGLSLLAGQDLTRMQRRLQNSTGQAARHILAAVASAPFPEADRIIALAAAHPEARVRKDAIGALVQRNALDKSESRKFIAKALEDKDPQVRGAALIALRDNPSRKIGKQILELIQGPRFESLGPSERRAYFEILLRSPGKEIRERLWAWVMKPIWWPNQQQSERRVLAAWILGRSFDREDRDLLERGTRSFFPGARAACRQSLKDAVRITPREPTSLPEGENPS